MNNKKITVSAPGKLILLGEHAVLYDKPCIVTAVDKRISLTIEVLNFPEFQLNAPDVNVVNYKKQMSRIGMGDIPKGAKFVEIALKNILEIVKRPSGLRITTKSEFSSKFGFGSSASSTVCTIKAVSEMLNMKFTPKEIFDLSLKTVLDIQGAGSGFDIAAAVYGGTIYFITGEKKIYSLTVSHLPLIVGYSGVKADTVTLINQVKEKADKYPAVIEGIYSSIEKLVDLAKKMLLEEDWRSLGDLMNINQGYLDALGVSNYKLANMIYSARSAGAYGAKLSGAGGGDCMIALTSHVKKNKIEKAIVQAGGEIIPVNTNASGVRVEK